MNKLSLTFLALFCLTLFGCASAQSHKDAVSGDSSDRISVGTVQREIKIGMSGDEVVSVLGSPNMVTSDSMRRETWVYDKVSTERAHSSSSGGLWIIVAGVSGQSGASSSSQRTLTIIIKFDEQMKVRDYSYRQSSF